MAVAGIKRPHQGVGLKGLVEVIHSALPCAGSFFIGLGGHGVGVAAQDAYLIGQVPGGTQP